MRWARSPRGTELITHSMVRAQLRRKKEPLVVRSFTFTPALDQMLQRLSQEASDFTGWTISTSAVIRALLRYVEQQDRVRLLDALFPFVEMEIKSGVGWGSKKQ